MTTRRCGPHQRPLPARYRVSDGPFVIANARWVLGQTHSAWRQSVGYKSVGGFEKYLWANFIQGAVACRAVKVALPVPPLRPNPSRPPSSTGVNPRACDCQGGGFVAVALFIRLAAQQQSQQAFGAAAHLQVLNLLWVMHVHKGLDGGAGPIHRTATEQRGQRPTQSACHAQRLQQAAAAVRGQPIFPQAQVLGFGVAVLAGKNQQVGVLSPAGHGSDAFVDVESAGLAHRV